METICDLCRKNSIQDMNKNRSIRDRIAMHVAVSEMVYSPQLNEAYLAFAKGRRASSRLEKAMWLVEHVGVEDLDSYFDFECIRICSHCGKPMCWGFVIDDGGEHYCSLSCLHKHYSSDEYLALYNHGKGNSYYTSWID